MSIFGGIWALCVAYFLMPIGIYLPSPSFVYGLVCPSGGVPFIAVPLVGSAFFSLDQSGTGSAISGQGDNPFSLSIHFPDTIQCLVRSISGH